MIESLFSLKKRVIEQILKSESISNIDKKSALEEYKAFVSRCSLKDSQGKLVVNSYLVQELKKAIHDRSIQLVMTQQDLAITADDLSNSKYTNEDVFKTSNDLVAVHVTPIPPENDVIKTPESTGLMDEMLFVDPNTGIRHSVPYLVRNDTIHFTLNCVVHNHKGGHGWDNYRYGVLIGLNNIDKSKILDLKGEDTYIDGDADLGNDYFLFCPLGERKEVAEKNPGATIIEYDGISLRDAISSMIILTGRKLEPFGSYGWGANEEDDHVIPDALELEKFAVANGYPVLKGEYGYSLHSETKYMARRMWKREYEALISLIEYNQKNKIDMPDDVLLGVMIYGKVFNLPGNVPVSMENYKEVVFPILEGHGYSVGDELFEGIEEVGNMKHSYFKPGDKFPTVISPSWETELRNRVIKFLKGYIKEDVTKTVKKSTI